MKIIRTSPFSGEVNEMELPVTPEQLRRWQDGTVAQRAFPNLTPAEREFIMTGITPEEWRDTFSGDMGEDMG